MSDKANCIKSAGFEDGLIQSFIFSLGSISGILSWILAKSSVGSLVRTTKTG